MKAQRVLLLLHPDFRPERKSKSVSTEAGLLATLKELGHHVEVCLLDKNIRQLEADVSRFSPTIVFNMMEEFRGEGIYDFHPVAWIEALGIPYTGCNPRGLVHSRDKFLALRVVSGAGVSVPKSALGVERGRQSIPAGMKFPLFVKLNREHASLGITAENRVTTPVKLNSLCSRLRKQFDSRILIQEFLAGQDVSVAVWGNDKAKALSPWQLDLGSPLKFATEQLKFSAAYRKRREITARKFELPLAKELKKWAILAFESLDLNGYARMDFRVTAEGRAYLVDVNANPNIAADEDFADSANDAGLTYPEMIQNILRLGMEYEPRR